MNETEFDKEVKEARQRVISLDKIDGWEDRLPSTIWCALKAGIMNKDSKSEFDAYVMLEDLCKEEHKEEIKRKYTQEIIKEMKEPKHNERMEKIIGEKLKWKLKK